MKILVVHESLFGNTAAVADAVAEGARSGRAPGVDDGGTAVRVVPVDDAPTHLDDVDLLLVAGPTHALGMTREQTRTDAVTKGALRAPRRGIREWITELEPRADLSVVTFDTRMHVAMLPGSAAKSAATALRHRGFRRAKRGETFWVSGTAGPLQPGEVERARAWGASLVEAPHPTGAAGR